MKYIIEGGKKLSGKVRISGNKNSTFPCLAAALLTDEEVVVENIPQISDIEVYKKILKDIGVEVNHHGGEIKLRARKITSHLDRELMIKLRGSIVLVGALLGRLQEAEFFFPGGDVIGKRDIDVHLEGFEALGGKITQENEKLAIKMTSEMAGQDYKFLIFKNTVTGTENLILASVLKKGTVTLKNCAKEPHVVDLCRMLISMGAKIEGVGTDQLKIFGASKLHGTQFKIGSDYMEIGTYMVAAAITGGKIKLIYDATTLDIDPIAEILKRFGVTLKFEPEGCLVEADRLTAVDKVITNIWPGFPTDMMSAVIVMATKASGMTLCHDWIYESRMFFVDKLISMGAKIIIADPHRVLVYGPSKLKARELETPDIRAGMALVLAALVSEGESIIHRAELIERGYEDVVGKLTKLGATIKKRP